MLNILTDSCADLSQQLLSAHQVEAIPLHVLINGKDYLDNQLTLNDLFSSVDHTGELPKTAAPSVNEFIEYFKRDVPTIYVGLSSQLSATMQNAELASKYLESDQLFIIDSLNLSTGIGLLALKAADLREKGYSPKEIVTTIKSLRCKVKTAFVIDTMDYLYKGGRCTALQAIFGSMLKIRPIIHVREDGTLGVLDKVRGGRTKALDTLLRNFENDLPNVDLTRVFITHTGCDEDAAYLAENIEKLAPVKKVLKTLAGSTIASHCGPNTIGILYISK
jgi:DegV family protein with EDD domain